MSIRRTIAAFSLLFITVAASAQSDPPPRPFLGLWITRWDYRTASDVSECIRRAESLGVTDVFWQVRGQADAFYKSDLEPWGRELIRDLPKDAAPPHSPGFDPLGLAVRVAHERGIKLHAWVNIMPLWKGKDAPTDPKHLFNAHADWRLRDSTGAPQALNEHYVIVNPLLPAVQDHIVAVCKDIVTRYAVDGLHMDYVRFVSDSMADPGAYPRDAESLAMFTSATGRTWHNSKDDEAAYRDFKRDRITALVKRIKAEAVGSRPGVVLTAAVWRRPDLGRETYLQDGAAWLNDGTLDRACPMIYTKDDKQFEGDLGAWVAAAPGKAISPGMGIYLHPPGTSGKQFDLARIAGTPDLSLFAYAALFESVDPNQDKSKEKVAERAERLKGIRAELQRLSFAPPAVESGPP